MFFLLYKIHTDLDWIASLKYFFYKKKRFTRGLGGLIFNYGTNPFPKTLCGSFFFLDIALILYSVSRSIIFKPCKKFDTTLR